MREGLLEENMKHIYRILGYFDRDYLKRAYFIGAIFFVLMGVLPIFTLMYHGPNMSNSHVLVNMFSNFLYAFVSTLLFPFSELLWDQGKSFVLGNTVLITSVIILFPLKFIINGLLWAFSIVIGPIGVVYLWYKNRAC